MRTDRRELHNALKELARVAPNNSSLPSLTNVHLPASNGTLHLSTTDLEVRLSYEMRAEGDINTCLPAKLLSRLVKPEGRGNAGEVEFTPHDDDRVAVTVDGVTSKLVCTAPPEFPAGFRPGEDQSWSLAAMWPGGALREALSYVLPAASRDETRKHLCVVRLEDQIMVTTDGHRLHLAALPSSLAEPLQVSSHAGSVLCRILGSQEQVIMARCKDQLRVRAGSWQLDTRIPDTKFPNHEQVVPAQGRQEVTVEVDSKVFTKALTHVSKLTRDKRVKVRINGAVTLTTWDAELGAAEIEVPTVSSNHDGEDLITGFDGRYLKDMASTKAATFEMSFDGPLDPMRVDLDGGKVAVVMPMRLD